MFQTLHTTLLTTALMALPGAAFAAPPGAAPATSLISVELIEQPRHWLPPPAIIEILRWREWPASALTRTQIDKLDATQLRQRDLEIPPIDVRAFADPVLAHVKEIQAVSIGLFTEIIASDPVGLNVGLNVGRNFGPNIGQSNVTPDYRQGDEATSHKAASASPDAAFIDEAQWYHRLAIWRSPVPPAIADPDDDDDVRGSRTFEINLTELARRLDNVATSESPS